MTLASDPMTKPAQRAWVPTALVFALLIAAFALDWLGAGPGPRGDRWLLFCLVSSVLCVLLAPETATSPADLGAWSLYALCTGLLAWLATGMPAEAAVRTLAASALLGWPLLCLARLLHCRRRIDSRHARLSLLTVLVLLCGTPIWLGPWIERLPGWDAAADLVVAINPLSLGAGILQIDYLRGEWFYRHSPLGSLPFSYPPPAVITAAYLFVGILSTLATRSCATPVAAFHQSKTEIRELP